jgi:hypothetical protein
MSRMASPLIQGRLTTCWVAEHPRTLRVRIYFICSSVMTADLLEGCTSRPCVQRDVKRRMMAWF